MRMGFGFGLCKGNGGPSPAFDSYFLAGTLPPGLTYTNSSTTRTYFGADGLLKTAVANEAVFEYDPVTRAMLGMRWEMEQRTNLLLQSTLPGGGAVPTGWTQSVGTGTSAPAASIYGNADGAVAYLQTATAQRPFLQQPVAVSASTTYSFSLLVESVSGGLLAQDCINVVALPAGASFTFPVCPANPSGGGTGVLTTGELRVQLLVAGTAGSPGFRMGIGCFANVTGTIQFSRPQLEVGTSRSSFIPTTTAAVTRQPDVLTATSISPWYNQSEGTVVFEGIVNAIASAGQGLYCFDDGTISERIICDIATVGSTFRVVDGGANQALITSSGASSGVMFRQSSTYKLNNFASCLNGGTVTADVSGTIPTITTLRLGVVSNALTGPFMGYARRFSYYQKAFPGAQIQGMSRV